MLANFTGRSEATRWIQSQTVDIVLVTSEEFLSVGTFVHYNTNTSTVVNKLSVVRVSEIVPGVVASDTEHVVQLERGIRRVAIRRTLPVRIRHLSVDYSAQVDHGLITFTKLFLLKITAVLNDLLLFRISGQSTRVELFIKIRVLLWHLILTITVVLTQVGLLRQAVGHEDLQNLLVFANIRLKLTQGDLVIFVGISFLEERSCLCLDFVDSGSGSALHAAHRGQGIRHEHGQFVLRNALTLVEIVQVEEQFGLLLQIAVGDERKEAHPLVGVD